MKDNKLILLNGPSSAGKSSIAGELGRRLGLSGADHAVLSIDDYMKISTDEEIWEDDVFEIMPDMCRDAAETLRQGKWAIVDHVITSERIYGALMNAAEGYGVIRVLVTCPLETLIEREKARGDRYKGSAEASWKYLYPKDGYDIRIDSSEMTPGQAAQAIAEALKTG